MSNGMRVKIFSSDRWAFYLSGGGAFANDMTNPEASDV
jgi:hypothetical protein